MRSMTLTTLPEPLSRLGRGIRLSHFLSGLLRRLDLGVSKYCMAWNLVLDPGSSLKLILQVRCPTACYWTILFSFSLFLFHQSDDETAFRCLHLTLLYIMAIASSNCMFFVHYLIHRVSKNVPFLFFEQLHETFEFHKVV